MKDAAKALEFEKAARIRDGMKALESLQEQNAVVDMDGEALVGGIGGRTPGDGPALEHAVELEVEPDRLALIGSSSGGHLALYAALTLVDVRWVGAFWPPVDPLTRSRYARDRIGAPVPDGQAFDAERLVASTEAYFGTEAAMAEASIAAVLREGRARHLPPVWVVRAGADLNVPSGMLDDLVDAYRTVGGDIALSEYPGEVHGFGHARHDGALRFQAELVQRATEALAR